MHDQMPNDHVIDNPDRSKRSVTIILAFIQTNPCDNHQQNVICVSGLPLAYLNPQNFNFDRLCSKNVKCFVSLNFDISDSNKA